MSCNTMGWLVCVTYGWEGRVLWDHLVCVTYGWEGSVLWDYMEIAAPEDGKYTKNEVISHCLLADRIVRVL